MLQVYGSRRSDKRVVLWWSSGGWQGWTAEVETQSRHTQRVGRRDALLRSTQAVVRTPYVCFERKPGAVSITRETPMLVSIDHSLSSMYEVDKLWHGFIIIVAE